MRSAFIVLTILALPSAALFFFSELAPPDRAPQVVAVESPAGEGSGQSNLHTSDTGEVLLSWIEPAGEGSHQLRFSRWNGQGWSAPRTIAEGAEWFVNWADFPSMASVGEDFLAAHTLVRNGERWYDYDIHLRLSTDGGQSWSDALIPHRDGVSAEHGFVSLVPLEDRLAAVWLDGRHSGDGHGSGAMTLRYAVIDRAGGLSEEAELDSRVCDCCQTSAARTSQGLLVAYRDRSPDEIRDIGIVRLEEGRWSEPALVHADGWKIAGCPVNGPALDARQDRVAVAWYTQAEDTPQVRLAFSADAGRTFSDPVRVDEGETMGRVDALLLPDGSAAVAWMEFGEGDEVRLLVRRITAAGRRFPPILVATTDSSRRSGFPHLALAGGELLIAWTSTESDRVRTARISTRALQSDAETRRPN